MGRHFLYEVIMASILLIVDPQNDFINGSLQVPGAQKAMDGLSEYVKTAGDRYERILITCDNHPITHCSFIQNGGEWPTHCVEGTEGAQIWPALKNALEGRRYEILHKGENPEQEEYSIFRNPHARMRLLELADKLKVEYFDLCGIAGDYCVLQTLKDGLEIFGTDKFQVLSAFVPSISDNAILGEFVGANNICIK